MHGRSHAQDAHMTSAERISKHTQLIGGHTDVQQVFKSKPQDNNQWDMALAGGCSQDNIVALDFSEKLLGASTHKLAIRKCKLFAAYHVLRMMSGLSSSHPFYCCGSEDCG
jgi:hypothetical protein